jgi:hypothetical protein
MLARMSRGEPVEHCTRSSFGAPLSSKWQRSSICIGTLASVDYEVTEKGDCYGEDA